MCVSPASKLLLPLSLLMTCLLVLNLLSALCAVETFLYVQVTVALSFSVRAVSALRLKNLDVNLLMMLSRSRRRMGADLSAEVSWKATYSSQGVKDIFISCNNLRTRTREVKNMWISSRRWVSCESDWKLWRFLVKWAQVSHTFSFFFLHYWYCSYLTHAFIDCFQGWNCEVSIQSCRASRFSISFTDGYQQSFSNES